MVRAYRSMIAAAVALAWWGEASAACSQTAWVPGRIVRLVIPFPPGGASDILARLLAERISATSGQGMIIENRPGAGTVIATEAVSRATPDGTTLLVMANSFVINPNLRTLSYDPLTSFEHICFLAQSPHAIVVNSQSTINSFADLMTQAKAKPGEMTFASVGPNTTHHIAIEMLKRASGLPVTQVSYQGGGQALTNLIGGHLNAVQANYIEVKENLGTSLRVIAVGGTQRLADLPDVPTIAELGFPEVIGVGWFGLVAPGSTPRTVTDEIAAQFKAALAIPEISAKLIAAGLIPEGRTCGADFLALLKTQHGRYAKAIKDAGLKEK
jgi:tripartite-type tricarboxylate transporter receptor subunit TctC